MTDEAKRFLNLKEDAQALREIEWTDCAMNPRVCTTMMHKAADLIESLAAELEQVKRERDAAAKCAKEFAARINAGEELTACEYCDKEFGTCNCNCMKEFEWRGVKE